MTAVIEHTTDAASPIDGPLFSDTILDDADRLINFIELLIEDGYLSCDVEANLININRDMVDCRQLVQLWKILRQHPWLTPVIMLADDSKEDKVQPTGCDDPWLDGPEAIGFTPTTPSCVMEQRGFRVTRYPLRYAS